MEQHHAVWFANQNVGVNKIGTAISNYANDLIQENCIPSGKYTNTSMRKLMVDRLTDAGCPELLIASAIGHYASNGSSVASGVMPF